MFTSQFLATQNDTNKMAGEQNMLSCRCFPYANPIFVAPSKTIVAARSSYVRIVLKIRDVIRRELCRVGFADRNPKPKTRNRLLKLVSNCETETRNPKPETDSESGFQATKPETRNPKPTGKVVFNRRNPKPETRNPKPTRIQLLGGSPDRNSKILRKRATHFNVVHFSCSFTA